jgi:hemerythrin-like domain-containing protein
MKVTQALIDNHHVIVKVLDCLESAADRLENGQDIRPGFFMDVINFNKGFIENLHQKAEEGILFEAMIKHGLSKKDPALTMVILEHDQSRLYMRRMRNAVERWQSGNKAARRDVIRNALGFVNLLRQHIQDEDDKLYPLAEKIIPTEAQQSVFDAFEKYQQKSNDQGSRDKFTHLAASLESEIC